jgi:hypothetical protein
MFSLIAFVLKSDPHAKPMPVSAEKRAAMYRLAARFSFSQANRYVVTSYFAQAGSMGSPLASEA